MKGTNRVFIFVVLLLSGILGVTWQSIQTERFGKILSSRVGKELKKRYGVNVKFERVEVGIIPLATRVVNLELEYKEYYLNAGKISLEFGLRDIFSKDFSIGRVSLEDSIIHLPKLKKKDNSTISLDTLFEDYKSYVITNLPFKLRGIALKNSIIDLVDYEVQAIDVTLKFFPNILLGHLSLGFEKKMFKFFELEQLESTKVNGFSGELQLTPGYLRLKEAQLLAENSFLQVSGKILQDQVLQGIKIDSFVDFKKVKKLIPRKMVTPKILPDGHLRLTGNIDGILSALEGSVDLEGNRLKSEIYKIKNFKSSLKLKESFLSLDSATALIGSGNVKLTEPVKIFDIKNKEFLWPRLFLETENLYTNDLLFFLPNLNRAKAYINGPLKFSINKNSIEINTYEGFNIDSLRLLNDDQKNVISNPKVYLGAGSKINLDFNGPVRFDTSISFPRSKFDFRGIVGDGQVNAELLPGIVDLKEFGPIAGLSLSGMGPVSGTITGPFEHVIFKFNLHPKNFEMLDFKLGEIAGTINFDLKSSLLRLRDLNGNFESLKYKGGGDINFKSRDDALDLSFEIMSGSLESSKIALKPILNPIIPFTKNVKLNYKSQISMKGGLSIDKMNVLGKLEAENITIGSEDIESAKFKFSLRENVLKFTDLNLRKISGALTGAGEFNLGVKSYSYRGTLSNLRLKDIYFYRLLNLGLDGDAYGEFYGVGDSEVFSSRSHIRLTNSNVENVRLNDSIITIYNNKKDLFFSTSLIGGEVKGEGYLNLAKNKSKKSALSFNVATTNLRNFAGILGKHNIINREIQGRLFAGMESDFYLEDISGLNFYATLNDVNFRYPGVSISNKKNPLKVSIVEGEFKDWDYEIKGTGFYLKSKGEGKLSEKMQLKHTFKINSSLSELVTENIEKSQGIIDGEHTLVGNLNNIDQYLKLQGSDLTIKAKSLPGLFSNLDFDIILEDNVMLVKSAQGTYGNGTVSANGSVKFIFPFPEVDLSLNVEKTRFPLLKKSSVVLSGDLKLIGKKLPYDLTGSLAIIQGEVIEDMGDLASSAINSDSYQRFIPVGFLEGSVGFINTDILLSSFSPIKIKNGMIDIGLGGNLRIFDSIFNPKLNGDMRIENPENKFVFKGHEFLLSEGLVRFIDGARKESPELRFSGVARINDYDVYININGPADNIGVEMSSNPPLSQEDILSLLTLGVTSDVSKNLGDRQRQSVTTLSIGSLIMDQLKINQSLNDSLGLRLSIQPEFIEDENNLLEGRTEDRTGGNRFRSSTVLKVQKRISKKVNLSLSSTVGGSVDQSQEMNVNYNINKSWSLEGVYEVRSNDELEQELPDSIGADVKYQWSF
ncbi:MAG: translocation/assembly module TamB [Bacteriovoracaceae bacterium]|nr:translocation/assembly module TamB [Bacteriovoracaceae bacterium]